MISAGNITPRKSTGERAAGATGRWLPVDPTRAPGGGAAPGHGNVVVLVGLIGGAPVDVVLQLRLA